ncbi:hypothetical protein A3B87_03365 [Candidatus Kuenenbacteria bacterium RIFCSPHIGHO2_02_FULL_39_13]|uniref:Uncharacterized protein n=1 Tax=Candidatus Kuenenbacteria bacterium RIFCSPHIGHO2_02_FULL_39_13 TaxID=1798561 RepID=A0A1F6FM98_9BACT|nr:MAG: hypothetical protein A3B87_03365 [Candidatus Kuenenbacteria bacterium RIFCSPHIGHO2_02_FULL_39_13]
MKKENKVRNPAIILSLSSRFAKEYHKYLCEFQKIHTIDEIQESKELTVIQRAFWTALIIEIGKLFDTYDGNKEVISLKKMPSFENCTWKKKIDSIHGEAVICKIISTRKTFTAHFSEEDEGVISVTEICDSKLGKLLKDLDQPLAEFNYWLRNQGNESGATKYL